MFLQYLKPINLNLPWLIVQLISFSEALSPRNAPEACHHPDVLRQLHDGIGGELMYLHLKIQKNIRKHQMWRHLQPSGKELKNNNFVWIRLWDSLFPRLMAHAFRKVTTINHLVNLTHSYDRGTKEEAASRVRTLAPNDVSLTV
jgi:hypothetical protein